MVITFIDKSFKISQDDYRNHPKQASEYLNLIEEIKEIQLTKNRYRELSQIELNILLVDKLKRVAEMQIYFINKRNKNNLFSNTFKVKKIEKISKNINFFKTQYKELKGIRILDILKIKQLESSIELCEIDEDLWDNDNYSNIELNSNIEDDDKYIDDDETINYEAIIMEALRNGEGDRFGF